MDLVVTCKDLSKSFRTQSVLSGVTFDLRKGEGLWVMGANGTGKTTLLTILAGLLDRDSGELRLAGLPFGASSHAMRSEIGYMPASENSLFLNATIAENLGFWARLQGHSAKESAKRVASLADLWELREVLNKPARELSSGWRRRAALARAFLHEPSLVLLDEPFSFLDNDRQRRTLSILEFWLKEKRGSLVVSSNIDVSRGPLWRSLVLDLKT